MQENSYQITANQTARYRKNSIAPLFGKCPVDLEAFWLFCSVATFSINSSWIPQPQPEQIVDSNPNSTEMGGHNVGSGQKSVGLVISEIGWQ